MSEEKLFKSISLTLVMYGFISFLQWGKFLVPLPAFEMVVFGLCLYFAFVEWRKKRPVALLFLFYGLFQFLSRDYNWAFFLSDEKLQFVSETLWIDVLAIAGAFALSLLLMEQNRRANWGVFFTYVFPIVLLTFLFLPGRWLLLLPLIGICVVHLKKKSLFTESHSIWAYLLLFSLASRELTLALL